MTDFYALTIEKLEKYINIKADRLRIVMEERDQVLEKMSALKESCESLTETALDLTRLIKEASAAHTYRLRQGETR